MWVAPRWSFSQATQETMLRQWLPLSIRPSSPARTPAFERIHERLFQCTRHATGQSRQSVVAAVVEQLDALTGEAAAVSSLGKFSQSRSSPSQSRASRTECRWCNAALRVRRGWLVARRVACPFSATALRQTNYGFSVRGGVQAMAPPVGTVLQPHTVPAVVSSTHAYPVSADTAYLPAADCECPWLVRNTALAINPADTTIAVG